MGVKNVVKNHYPHPDRILNADFFSELERRGYDYKNLNETGAGTLHYDMENAAYNTNLGDWVPRWCFPFIFWAARASAGEFRRGSIGLPERELKQRKTANRRRFIDAENCRFPTTTRSLWTLRRKKFSRRNFTETRK
jgi:hypothetical protein